MKLRAPLLSLICASLLLASEALALDLNSGFHFRSGLLSTSYSTPDGSVEGSHSIPASLDLEYEVFLAPRSSFVIRALFGIDTHTARMLYGYSGVGKRYYVFSRGAAADEREAGTRIVIAPKWRFYVGGDLGISQVVVKSYGTVLQANSTLFDLGPNVGMIYQASRSIGIETHLGYTRGFGFSNISVSASTIRAFLGAVYSL